MSQPDTSDTKWKSFYKVGGICLILAGILVAATIPLIPILIPSLAPATPLAGLQSLQNQGTLFGVTWGLYLVSDLLYLIAVPALFLVLKQVNRAALLIAVIFNTVFVAIDVGVNIPLNLALVKLSSTYAAAQNSTERTAIIATAQLTMNITGIATLVATFLQFAAIVLVSYTMLKGGVFKKSSGYIGIVSGILALLFIPAITLGSMMLAGLFNIGGFVFLVIWSLLVGYKLWKLG